MVQADPAARLGGQLLVSAKSPTLWMPLIVIGALPVFDSVTDWRALAVPTTWLANVRLLGERVAIADVLMPVPVSATLCGLPLAESLMLMLPMRVPTAVGVNVTLMVQDDPAATLGQL